MRDGKSKFDSFIQKDLFFMIQKNILIRFIHKINTLSIFVTWLEKAKVRLL